MSVRAFYDRIGGDYEEVIQRLTDDQLIKKYLNMFVKAEDYSRLQEHMQNHDWQAAFESVHNIKGNALNLGLAGLIEASSLLCEALRYGEPTADMEMMQDLTNCYLRIINEVSQIR